MRTERMLEAWEFGDPADVAARREAQERGRGNKKRREIELRMNRRRIKALAAEAIRKARTHE